MEKEKLIPMVLNYIFIFTNETPVSLAKALDVSDHLVRQWCSRGASFDCPSKSNLIHLVLYIYKHYGNRDHADVVKAVSFLNYLEPYFINIHNRIDDLKDHEDMLKLELLLDDVSKFKKRYSSNNKALILSQAEKYKITDTYYDELPEKCKIVGGFDKHGQEYYFMRLLYSLVNDLIQ